MEAAHATPYMRVGLLARRDKFAYGARVSIPVRSLDLSCISLVIPTLLLYRPTANANQRIADPDGSERCGRYLGVFDFDTPARKHGDLCALLGVPRDAKSEVMVSAIGEFVRRLPAPRTIDAICAAIPFLGEVRREAERFGAALASLLPGGARVIVFYSGGKGFRVLVLHEELMVPCVYSDTGARQLDRLVALCRRLDRGAADYIESVVRKSGMVDDSVFDTNKGVKPDDCAHPTTHLQPTLDRARDVAHSEQDPALRRAIREFWAGVYGPVARAFVAREHASLDVLTPVEWKQTTYVRNRGGVAKPPPRLDQSPLARLLPPNTPHEFLKTPSSTVFAVLPERRVASFASVARGPPMRALLAAIADRVLAGERVGAVSALAVGGAMRFALDLDGDAPLWGANATRVCGVGALEAIVTRVRALLNGAELRVDVRGKRSAHVVAPGVVLQKDAVVSITRALARFFEGVSLAAPIDEGPAANGALSMAFTSSLKDASQARVPLEWLPAELGDDAAADYVRVALAGRTRDAVVARIAESMITPDPLSTADVVPRRLDEVASAALVAEIAAAPEHSGSGTVTNEQSRELPDVLAATPNGAKRVRATDMRPEVAAALDAFMDKLREQIGTKAPAGAAFGVHAARFRTTCNKRTGRPINVRVVFEPSTCPCPCAAFRGEWHVHARNVCACDVVLTADTPAAVSLVLPYCFHPACKGTASPPIKRVRDAWRVLRVNGTSELVSSSDVTDEELLAVV